MLEFKSPDKIQTKIYAKITICSAHNLHVCMCIYKYNTYFASLNFPCLKYACPVLWLFKIFVCNVTTNYGTKHELTPTIRNTSVVSQFHLQTSCKLYQAR